MGELLNKKQPDPKEPAKKMPSVAFLLITEPGRLERESLLAVRSLRTFGGFLADAPVFSFEPRSDKSFLADSTLRQLSSLKVDHRALLLNIDYPDYPYVNKILVGAWAEINLKFDVLVFLDSDLVFFDEPSEVLKCEDYYQAAVRPVHGNFVSSKGPEDPYFPFWKQIYKLADVRKKLYTRSTVDGNTTLADFNSGFVAVTRERGIFYHARKVFAEAWPQGLCPGIKGQRFFLEQCVTTAAICARAQNVLSLPRNYNYPICGHNRLPDSEKVQRCSDLVCMHYHRGFEKWYKVLGKLQRFEKLSSEMTWLINQLKELGFPATSGNVDLHIDINSATAEEIIHSWG